MKNELFLFTLIKYTTHVVNFLRVVVAASLLGPFFFGIWGFLNLVVQYLSHLLLGIQYSVNLELAVSDRTGSEREKLLVSSSLFLTTVIGFVLVLAGSAVYFFRLDLFSEYEFGRYSIAVTVVVALLNFQQVCFNVYRVYGKLYKIAFAEFAVAVSLLVVLMFQEGDRLIFAMFVVWIASLAISLFTFFIRPPIPMQVRNFPAESATLLRVGFPLLIYNLSYYLIILSSTTVLSTYYSIETMGFYTLSNSISNAILLGINSILWAFFPVLLNRLRDGVPIDEVRQTIGRIDRIYLTTIFLIFLGFVFVSPAIYHFLEKYKPAEATLNILFVTQIILASNFAANALTIARKKHLHLASLSFLSAIVVTIASIIFAELDMPYKWIAFSTVVGAIAFSVLTRIYHERLGTSESSGLLEVTPARIALVVILAGNLFFQAYLIWFNLAGVAIYLGFHWKRVKELWTMVAQKLLTGA